MKPLKTWALIADGARAHVLENTVPVHGDAHHGTPGLGVVQHDWTPVDGLVFHGDHSATHDLVSDGQGRSFSSSGGGRSALEAHTDPHRDQKAKFVNQLAKMLAEQLQAGAFHRLVIAAPPVTLGDLRGAISDRVRATVIAEFPHDLTKVPNHEISPHLKPISV